jgi:hypothetical protein
MTIKSRNLGLFASVALVLFVISPVATMLLATEPTPAKMRFVVPSQPQGATDKTANRPQEGYVITSDGVHLFYQVVSNGPETVVLPG